MGDNLSLLCDGLSLLNDILSLQDDNLSLLNDNLLLQGDNLSLLNDNLSLLGGYLSLLMTTYHCLLRACLFLGDNLHGKLLQNVRYSLQVTNAC